MIAGPVKTFDLISCEKVSSKEDTFSKAGLINETRFDKLSASVFDSMEARRLISQNDLSAMLHTIAGISSAR